MAHLAKHGNGNNPAVHALAAQKQLDPAFLLALGVRDSSRPGSIAVEYLSEDGEILYVRYRNPPGSDERFGVAKKTQLVPYGLWRLPDARTIGELVITEGESDTWTLWYQGIHAIGIPGNAAGSIQAEHLRGIHTVLIAVDNDEAGRALTDRILRRLVEIGYTGTVVRVLVPQTNQDHRTDVSDYYRLDPRTFRIRWSGLLSLDNILTLPTIQLPRPVVLPTIPPTPPNEEALTAYGMAALQSECAVIAATERGRNDQINKSAYAIGGYIGAGIVDASTAEAMLVDAGAARGLSERETRSAVRSGLTAGAKEPRDTSGIGAGQYNPNRHAETEQDKIVRCLNLEPCKFACKKAIRLYLASSDRRKTTIKGCDSWTCSSCAEWKKQQYGLRFGSYLLQADVIFLMDPTNAKWDTIRGKLHDADANWFRVRTSSMCFLFSDVEVIPGEKLVKEEAVARLGSILAEVDTALSGDQERLRPISACTTWPVPELAPSEWRSLGCVTYCKMQLLREALARHSIAHEIITRKGKPVVLWRVPTDWTADQIRDFDSSYCTPTRQRNKNIKTTSP